MTVKHMKCVKHDINWLRPRPLAGDPVAYHCHVRRRRAKKADTFGRLLCQVAVLSGVFFAGFQIAGWLA